MSKVFVSHPGLQHAHQLAWALYENGWLQSFWSGVPVVGPNETLPIWLPSGLTKKMKLVAIPKMSRRHPIIFQALLRLGQALPGLPRSDETAHRLYRCYDWWVSRHVHRLRPKVVVAYENAAYHTFLAAKSVGARCVLDAASFHHSMGTHTGVVATTPFRVEINRRKDDEAAFADMILTCSPLAADSYAKAGVSESKLQPVLLGANLPEKLTCRHPHHETLRFIFAGSLSYLKSIDVILSVFRKFYSERLPVEVLFVGGMGDSNWLSEIDRTPNAIYRKGTSQQELFDLFAQSDCLLLPSRFDSFGMVVAEAMACGTPAIVSSRVGAKAMIEQFPGSGWIVEPEVDSLYQCLRRLVDQPGDLFVARRRALEAARQFTWEAYRRRVAEVLRDLVESS